MKFGSLITKIAVAPSSAHLRSTFMAQAGQLLGATAWGIDLLDRRSQVMESDLFGLPEHFRDRYQEVGCQADLISQRMIQEQIPVHTLSMQSLPAWQQSNLYQQLFRPYRLEHGVVAPLVGGGQVVGGIYLLRGDDLPAFNEGDLIQLSCLCQHLSVRLAGLQLAIAAASTDGLTPREQDIVDLVAQGLTNREIGAKLHISPDAVKQTLKRVFRKLNVSARTAMVAKLRHLL
jgi:DNA-binding CsgD family transcriptional regulator